MHPTYKLSKEEYTRALKLVSKLSYKQKIFIAFSVCFLAFLIVFDKDFRNELLIPLIFICTIIQIAAYFYNNYYVKKRLDKIMPEYPEQTFSISAKGLRVTSSEQEIDITLDDVRQWRHNDEFVILFIKPKRLFPKRFLIIPKSINNDAFNINTLIQYLKDNVGEDS